MNLNNLLIEKCRKLKLPTYKVQDNAPSSLQDVMSHFKSTGELIVWSGASDQTIWGSKQGNWLFRAWHNYTHILSLGQFNATGEAQVCRLQQSQTESSILQKVIEIEIMGQLEYMNQNGTFPINQIEFFKSKIGALK